MKKYTQKQIDEILDKHKKWLNGEGGGERANLESANLENANLTGANLDYSAFPLWCGSLRVQFDDRLIIQLLYHLLSIAKRSKNISTEIKQTLLCDDLICIANKFHRVKECGMIEAEESECKNS